MVTSGDGDTGRILAAKTNPGAAGNGYRDSDRTPGSDRSRPMPHSILIPSATTRSAAL